MPLITCGECAASVSTAARLCPSCGAPRKRMLVGQPRRMSLWLKLLIGFLAIGAIGSAIEAIIGKAPKTPSEIAAERAADHRDTVALIAAQSLKDSLNDPSSLELVKVLVDEGGTLVCMRYRAANGFGALILAQTVIRDGEVQRGVSAWRRNCGSRPLYDVTAVSYAMR